MENTNIKLPEGWHALSYVDYDKLFATLTDMLRHINHFESDEMKGLLSYHFDQVLYYTEDGNHVMIGCDEMTEDDEGNELDEPAYKPYISLWDIDVGYGDDTTCYLEVNDNVKAIVQTILHAIENDLDIEVQVDMWRELSSEPPIEFSPSDIEDLL